MEGQMEKKMESEIETGVIFWFTAIRVFNN